MMIAWYESLENKIRANNVPKEGFVAIEYTHINKENKRFGAVAYNRLLTNKELKDLKLGKTHRVRKLYDFEKGNINE